MKPLPAAPLTIEDHNIWCRVTWDGHLRMLHEHSTHLDRRDAGLMYQAQLARYQMFPVDMPPLSMIGPNGVSLACGGAIFLPANPYKT
jgi:hypothetical protein